MAYVENIVGFINYCIDNDFKGYHLYNYADKPDYSMNDLIVIAEKSLNKKLPSVRIPYSLGYLGGLCFDLLSFVTKKNYSISSVRIKKFCAVTQFKTVKPSDEEKFGENRILCRLVSLSHRLFLRNEFYAKVEEFCTDGGTGV